MLAIDETDSIVSLTLKVPEKLQLYGLYVYYMVHICDFGMLRVNTVEPHYNENFGTMNITLLYQVSHYIRVKKLRNIKSEDRQNYLVIIRGFW